MQAHPSHQQFAVIRHGFVMAHRYAPDDRLIAGAEALSAGLSRLAGGRGLWSDAIIDADRAARGVSRNRIVRRVAVGNGRVRPESLGIGRILEAVRARRLAA